MLLDLAGKMNLHAARSAIDAQRVVDRRKLLLGELGVEGRSYYLYDFACRGHVSLCS